jgi:hypothetical protein
LLAWLTWLPVVGPLPQTVHTRAMIRNSVEGMVESPER